MKQSEKALEAKERILDKIHKIIDKWIESGEIEQEDCWLKNGTDMQLIRDLGFLMMYPNHPATRAITGKIV